MTFFLITAFSVWRIGLFLTAFIASKVLPFAPRFPYADALLIPSGLPSWIWSFANFDGVHYITIAKSGYSAQFTQVFFPFYPILMRFISFFFGKNYILTGLSVSNASFLVALYLFTLLLKKDRFKKNVRWILAFLITFPFSFFFGSLYTESVFLIFVLAAFLFAREEKWLLAGIFGGLASATRITGIFLLPALLWEQYQGNIKYQISKIKNIYLRLPTQSGKHVNKISESIQFLFRAISMFFRSPITYMVPLGLVSYMIYLQWKFNDFLYFWHAQPVFGAQRSGSGIILPFQVLWRYARILTSVPLNNYAFWVAFWELSSFILVAVFLFIAYKKHVRLSYLIFSSLAVFIPSFTGTLSSMPRYMLVAFPIYIVLGMTESKVIKGALLVLQVILLTLFTGLFVQGNWVS